MKRAEEYGLVFNADKCLIGVTEIHFVGLTDSEIVLTTLLINKKHLHICICYSIYIAIYSRYTALQSISIDC